MGKEQYLLSLTFVRDEKNSTFRVGNAHYRVVDRGVAERSIELHDALLHYICSVINKHTEEKGKPPEKLELILVERIK